MPLGVPIEMDNELAACSNAGDGNADGRFVGADFVLSGGFWTISSSDLVFRDGFEAGPL